MCSMTKSPILVFVLSLPALPVFISFICMISVQVCVLMFSFEADHEMTPFPSVNLLPRCRPARIPIHPHPPKMCLPSILLRLSGPALLLLPSPSVYFSVQARPFPFCPPSRVLLPAWTSSVVGLNLPLPML